MFRRLIMVLVSFTGVSIKAEEILVKISNRIYGINIPEGVVPEEEISPNQLIDLLKSAQEINEIKLAVSKNNRGVGTWTETSARPGTWTETSAKLRIKSELNTIQSGQ